MPADAFLKDAIALIKVGELESARKILIQILRENPHNETAWIWMAETVTDLNQRIAVLEQCLKSNPHSDLARRALTAIYQRQIVSKPLPPLPEEPVKSAAPPPRKEWWEIPTREEPLPAPPPRLARDEPKSSPTQTFTEQSWEPPKPVEPAAPGTPVSPFIGVDEKDILQYDSLREELVPEVAVEKTRAEKRREQKRGKAARTEGEGEARSRHRTPLIFGIILILLISVIAYVVIFHWTELRLIFTSLLGGGEATPTQSAPLPTKTITPELTPTPGNTTETPPPPVITFELPVSTYLQLPLTGEERATALAYSPDGNLLVGGTSTGKVYFWRAADGTLLSDWLNQQAAISTLAFSPDGALAASAAHDRTVVIWKVEGEQITYLTTLDLADPVCQEKLDCPVTALTFSPDGAYLAAGVTDTVNGQASAIWLWNNADWSLVGKLIDPKKQLNGDIHALTFSADGGILYSTSASSVLIWTVADLRLERRLSGHTDGVSDLALSPDSTRLASASWDSTVRIWRLNQVSPLSTALEGEHGALNAVTYSPDGSLLAALPGEVAPIFWRLSDGAIFSGLIQEDELVNSFEPAGLAFSPDGRTLAQTAGSLVQVWLLEESQPPVPTTTP